MMKKPIRYVNCSYREGKLRKELTGGGFCIAFFMFWLFPLIALVELITSTGRDSFWITEKEYYKTKYQEITNKEIK